MNRLEKADMFKMTDELRELAQQKAKIDILYITGRSSPFGHMRGENLMKSFKNFYDKVSDISLTTLDVKQSSVLTPLFLSKFNLVWMDNVSDYSVVENISNSISEIAKSLDPDVNEKLGDSDYLNQLDIKRQRKLRVVTAVDEFVWEGVAGRETSLMNVRLIESAIAISDTVVVPTIELKQLIADIGIVDSEKVEVLTSSASSGFFPLFKLSRKTGTKVTDLGKKPKILIKGVEISQNVQDFVIANHKRFDITISSVGQLDKKLEQLVLARSVKHIMHWANPKVDHSNMLATHAIERDSEFDFTILSYTEDPQGAYYELCLGDEDAVQAIASGSLPIFIAKHLYDDAECLANVNKELCLSPKDSHKLIENAVAKYSVGVSYNAAYEKISSYIRAYVMESPAILSSLYKIAIGKEMAWARAELVKEAETTKSEEVK